MPKRTDKQKNSQKSAQAGRSTIGKSADTSTEQQVKPHNQATRQPPRDRIKKLVSRGGGTKGLLLLGAQEELEKAGAWEDVREVWGSSAGGIVSMLQGLGLNAAEIRKEMTELNFKDFMDKSTVYWSEALGFKSVDPLGVTDVTDKLAALHRVIASKGHGVYKGDAFSDYAKHKIASQIGNPNLTFAELHDAATNPASLIYDPRLKDIMLTGSKIAPLPPELRLFNWQTTPNMPIWKAVRITMSFPGAFKAVEHTNEETGASEIFVDGGLKDNLPINPAVRFKGEVDDIHLRQTEARSGVLGVSMENTETIDYVRTGHSKDDANLEKFGVTEWGGGMVKAVLSNIEVLREYKDQIIMPDDCNEETLNFDMDDKTKAKLLTEGTRAANALLAAREDFEGYDIGAENDHASYGDQFAPRENETAAAKESAYKKYHREHDIKHIMAAWGRLNLLRNVLDLREMQNNHAGTADGMQNHQSQASKANDPAVEVLAEFDPTGEIQNEIASIEQRYEAFDINFQGTPAQYNARLEEIYVERELHRNEAISKANFRRVQVEETERILRSQENLEEVGNIIQAYDERYAQFTALAAECNIVIAATEAIKQHLLQDGVTQAAKMACDELDKSIKILVAIDQKQDAGLTREEIKREHQLQKDALRKHLDDGELSKEQKATFMQVYAAYSDNLLTATSQKKLPFIAGEGIDKYLTALKNSGQQLITEMDDFKNSMRKLEVQCVQSGLQILAADLVSNQADSSVKSAKKTDATAAVQRKDAKNAVDAGKTVAANAAKILAEPASQHTIGRLRQEYAKAKVEHTQKLRSGNLDQIGHVLSPKHYMAVVNAKKSAYQEINKHTNYAVKMADLLKRSCNFLYKGYHFLASLNPFSSYKSVMLMREVHKKLENVQEYLERNHKQYKHDQQSRTMLSAIEEISTQLEDKNLSRKVRDRHYKTISNIMDSLEQHQEKVKAIAAATAEAPLKSSSSSLRSMDNSEAVGNSNETNGVARAENTEKLENQDKAEKLVRPKDLGPAS